MCECHRRGDQVLVRVTGKNSGTGEVTKQQPEFIGSKRTLSRGKVHAQESGPHLVGLEVSSRSD